MAKDEDGSLHGVVAMLDLLGTRGSWLRGEPKEAILSWNELQSAIMSMIREAKRNATVQFGEGRLILKCLRSRIP